MNSEIPIIKVNNKPLTDKTVNDLNKLSMILLQKQKSNMNGGKRKKSKTRKIKRSKYY
jgi:hypothetical protein